MDPCEIPVRTFSQVSYDDILITLSFCFAMRFLEGAGGEAGGVLGTADNRRPRDDWSPYYREGFESEVSLIYRSGAGNVFTISTESNQSTIHHQKNK